MHPIRPVLAALLAATLAGCGGDGGDGGDGGGGGDGGARAPVESASTSPAAEIEYVAMGDSYAAAPGVPGDFGDDGCFRSSGNYAHRIAETLDGVALTDVTCSGATTDDVLATQVPALTESTGLVTIGVGGNDLDLFTEVLLACTGALPCTESMAPVVERALPDIERNIGETLDAVVAAAPEAQVIVVGYPDLVPDRGTCPDRIALAEEDLPLVDSVNRGLSSALRDQARERGLDYVDVARASQGHDICSDDPWVNGSAVAPDGTIPFHPLAVEQEAVARLIARLIDPS